MNLEPFLSWQFAAAAIAVQAVMQTLKKVTKIVRPSLFDSRWFRGFVATQNVVWGVAMAAPASFLMGDTFGQRAIVGACAGFLSHTLYEVFLKRIKPAADAAGA